MVKKKKDKDSPIIYTGTLIHYDQENLNGRIYSKEVVEKMIEDFNKRKEEGIPMLGELGYPESLDISLSNVSHEIQEMHINEDKKCVECTIKLLDTKHGNLVKSILDPKMGQSLLSARPRATGTLNEKGEIENYRLYSVDLINTDDDSFANIKPNDCLDPLDNKQ